jgi:hypothetical protein
LKTLRTPSVNPLKITAFENVYPSRRSYNKVIKIQNKDNPNLITPLFPISQAEELKYSPRPKVSKESKGKAPQREIIATKDKTL